MFKIFDLQRTLVAAASPTGFEKNIREAIEKLAKPHADEMKVDAMGNLICRKKGTGKKVMMAAHMDAIGLMIKSIDEKGFLWFRSVGGISPATILNTRFRLPGGVRGIVNLRKTADFSGKNLMEITMNDVYMDIGAKSRSDAEKHVKIGDVALFEGDVRQIAGGNIMGPYADDLSACAVMLMAMEKVKDSPNDLYFVFTTQEEVGCRGARTAAYAIEPDYGIACDVCSVGDTPANRLDHMEVKLGNGPTVKIMDESVICSPEFNETIKKIAKKNKIAVQDEILSGGGTDTCEMQMAKAGCKATCISIPSRNIHSPVEIFNSKDAEDAASLIAAVICEKL